MNNTARDCLQATIKKIDGAYAPVTIRAYKSNFENFIKFCDENNMAALPASSEIVANYIKKLSIQLKSSSIKIAVASISALHNLNSLKDPTQHTDVKIEMRRMYRTLGRYAKQAYGINKDLLDKMVAATDNSLRGVRDKAILLVAYDSLCRRSFMRCQCNSPSSTRALLSWRSHTPRRIGKRCRPNHLLALNI